MTTTASLNPTRDAIALLLADLDGEPTRRFEIAAPYFLDSKALVELIGALADTARYLGTHFADKSEQELRDELQLLAEGFALE